MFGKGGGEPPVITVPTVKAHLVRLRVGWIVGPEAARLSQLAAGAICRQSASGQSAHFGLTPPVGRQQS